MSNIEKRDNIGKKANYSLFFIFILASIKLNLKGYDHHTKRWSKLTNNWCPRVKNHGLLTDSNGTTGPCLSEVQRSSSPLPKLFSELNFNQQVNNDNWENELNYSWVAHLLLGQASLEEHHCDHRDLCLESVVQITQISDWSWLTVS